MAVKGDIIFSASVVVDRQQAEHSNVDILKYKQDKYSMDMGMQIAEAKGWEEVEDEERTISQLTLYVFTPQELKDFIDVKFQRKLREMGLSSKQS